VLQEAARLQGQARWAEAASAALRAQSLLGGGRGRPEQRQRLEALQADLEMVQKVERIYVEEAHPAEGEFDFTRADLSYARAFQEFGINADALDPAEAADLLSARAVRVELAAALDGWAVIRRYALKADARSWQHLVAISRLVDPDEHRNRFRDAWERGHGEDLARLATEADVGRLPASSLLLLGEFLHARGRAKEAVHLLRQAQRQYPGNFWINYYLAAMIRRAKPTRWDEAMRYSAAAVALRPESAEAHDRLGQALAGMGSHAAAVACFEEAIRRKPEYANAHHNLAVALNMQGRNDEALVAVREALRLKPDNARAWNTLGNALAGLKRLDEARAAYQEAVRQDPDYASALCNLGRVYKDQGELDLAIAALQKAVRLEPDLALAHLCLGIALAAKGRPDEAVTAYQAALDLDPNNATAHYNLAVALRARGRVADAIAAYRQATRLQPGMAEAHYNLGCILSDRADLPNAIAAFRAALRARPDYGKAQLNLAQALRRTGQLAEAVPALEKAAQLLPDSAYPFHGLGLILLQKKEFDKAVAPLRQAIALQEKQVAAGPKNAALQHELGTMLNDLAAALLQGPPENRDEARTLLERAVRHGRLAVSAAPQNRGYARFLANHYRNLTAVLAGLGLHADAARVVAEWVPALPDDGEEYVKAAERLARCATAAANDPRLPEGERRELVREHGDRALALLRQPKARGNMNLKELKHEPHYAVFRQRADFRQLLAGLEAEAGKP
jgi:tetratricopeptide (TPR) repeat protein